MALTLTPYGAAGTVTGSNFMIETDKAKVLVDCGMEQGADFCEKAMYEKFPYDPSAVDALVLTHAHLDHVGRIPKLVKEGFRGKLYMTEPTKDLAELILQDSVGILFEDAKHLGVDPLFTQDDVDATLPLIETIPYHEEKEIAPGMTAYLRDTGHILGSASVRLTDTADSSSLALTGDIGNSPSPLLPDFEPVSDADAVLMESVYGNRLHPDEKGRVEHLRDTLKAAIDRGGNILIPAFSIERTQLMLYELSNFFEDGSLPKIPVYLDSPLAINVTRVYEKWGANYFKQAAEKEMKQEGSLFEFPFLTKTLSRDESKEIANDHRQKIIIAGAGMSHGGRIGIWEEKYLPDTKTSLIIVGYQAPGSPGRRMVEGDKKVTIRHRDVDVRAHVEILEGWSGHADRDGLLRFAEGCLKGGRVKTIFVAIGEPSAERFLAQRIHDYLGGHAVVPEAQESWSITKGEEARKA